MPRDDSTSGLMRTLERGRSMMSDDEEWPGPRPEGMSEDEWQHYLRSTSPPKLYIGNKLVSDPMAPGGKVNRKRDAAVRKYWDDFFKKRKNQKAPP